MSKKGNESSSQRWWEFYFIRYALGTVVGAICVYFLLDTMGLKSQWLMMPPITEHAIDLLSSSFADNNVNASIVQVRFIQDLYGFNLAQLTLLGIYGLAFNYFASAPVLVWHAVRFQFKNMLVPCLWYLFIMGVIVLALFYLNEIVVLLVGLVYIVIQLCYLYAQYKDENIIDRYRKLHVVRKANCIDVDSYKHLREHGNAFLIVFHNVGLLTVILALCHFNSDHTMSFIWLTLLWILPASVVYFLGHHIESKLIESYETQEIKIDDKGECDTSLPSGQSNGSN